MLFHRGLQHLRWQLKEVFRNVPHQGHGPFHQTGDFCQQTFVVHHFQPLGKGEVLGVRPDHFGAFGGGKDHMISLQFRGVVFKSGDRKAAGAHKAVAFGAVPCRDAINIQCHHFGAGLIGQNAENGMQWAHPAQGSGAPAHGFLPWEIADGGFQNLGHNFRRRAARLFNAGEIDCALGRVALFQLIHGHACATQKPFDGFVRRTDLWAFAFFPHGWAFCEHSLKRQGQAPRGRKARGMAVGQARGHQPIGDPFFQILSGANLHTRGDFFGKEFNQQIRHNYWPSGLGGQVAGRSSPSKASFPQVLISCQAKPRPSGSTATMRSMP